MNPEDLELEAFQACFLEALAANIAAADIQQALLKDPATMPFRNYIAGFDDEMLEVAAVLVKKWGVRSQTVAGANPDGMPH